MPHRDDAALAQALRTLAQDPELRRRLGQAGQRRVVEHFTQSAMAERHIALYQRILDEDAG